MDRQLEELRDIRGAGAEVVERQLRAACLQTSHLVDNRLMIVDEGFCNLKVEHIHRHAVLERDARQIGGEVVVKTLGGREVYDTGRARGLR